MTNKIIIVFIIGMISGFVLLWDTPPSELLADSENTADIEYAFSIAKGSTLKNYNAEGDLTHSLNAETLRQFKPDNGPERLELEKPHLKITEPERSPWIINSEFGTVNTDSEFVKLTGNVQAKQSNTRVGAALNTEELSVDIANSYATTDKPVIIIARGHRVESTGISAYFEEERIELHADVKGTHERP